MPACEVLSEVAVLPAGTGSDLPVRSQCIPGWLPGLCHGVGLWLLLDYCGCFEYCVAKG